jgi:hypothetical protein
MIQGYRGFSKKKRMTQSCGNISQKKGRKKEE